MTVPRLLALVVAAALALTGCAQRPAEAPAAAASPESAAAATATIGLTYIPDIQFAPFYVAVEQGLFAAEGVDAELRHHGANEGLFTALTSGQEDFVLAGGDELVQARAEGLDLVAIGQYYHAYPVVVIVPDASPVTTAADLRGRSIGVPGRFGESWFGLQALLAEAGLTEADVEIVEIGYTAQAALTTGKVEAVVGFANNDQVQFGRAGVPTRTIALTDSGEVPLVSIVLATTREVLDERPEVAGAVARGMVAGIEATVEAPASAVQAAGAYIPTLGEAGSEASAAATLEATVPLWTPAEGRGTGRLDPAQWEAMVSFMAGRGLISAPVTAAEAVAPDVLG